MHKKNRKHIGFLIMNLENGGGTERVTSIIANELVHCNYDISIISCQHGKTSQFPLDNEVNLYSLEGNKCNNPVVRKLYVENRLMRYVKDEKINILVAVDVALYLYLFPLQMKKQCKCIAWEHFNYFIQPNKMVKYARKLAARFADCVVVLGKNDLKNYTKHYKKINKIIYIYNPIAIDINPQANIKSKKIIAMGRLNEQKGFDLLIEAWAKLEPEFMDWELDIFGEGILKEQLQKQIKENNLSKVFFKGYSSDVAKEMLDSSIFALSSRYEGFVLVLLEAQAAGLPCVSFKCKEGPEEIIDDGVNGFLVEPLNVDLFADKMRLLMQDENLRIEFSKNSTKDLERFDRKLIINKWDKLLKEL